MTEFGMATCAAIAYQRDFEAWLEKCAYPLRKAGFTVDVQVNATDDTAGAIIMLARQSGCELIVIGSRSKDMMSSIFLGSVARDVIRQTTIPLLLQWIEPTAKQTEIQCEDQCTDTLRHILFATDFSPFTAAAQKAMLQLAINASQVECIHVLQAGANAENTALAKRGVTDIEKEIEAVGCKTSGSVLQGKPADAIAHHAKEKEASLIIVGKHGQGWVESRLIGSTAARIAEIAGRPVLMVP